MCQGAHHVEWKAPKMLGFLPLVDKGCDGRQGKADRSRLRHFRQILHPGRTARFRAGLRGISISPHFAQC